MTSRHLPTSDKPLSIGFFPRQSFATSLQALQALYRYTRQPFSLLVVDCDLPPVYRDEIHGLLAGRSNARVLRTDRFLTPNESRNLVLDHVAEGYLCLMENDDIVSPGWLEHLVEASADYENRALIVPMILEEHGGQLEYHYDPRQGPIHKFWANGEWSRMVVVDPEAADWRHWDRPRVVPGVENHVLFADRTVFDKLGPFDEQLISREHYDLSLAAKEHGVPLVLQPLSRVYLMEPDRVLSDERAYWQHVWDVDRGIASNTYLRQKWNLVAADDSVGFIKVQYAKALYRAWERHKHGQLPAFYHQIPFRKAGYRIKPDRNGYLLVGHSGDGPSVRINQSAAQVWEYCGSGARLSQIVAELAARYPEHGDQIVDDVIDTVSIFMQRGLVECQDSLPDWARGAHGRTSAGVGA